MEVVQDVFAEKNDTISSENATMLQMREILSKILLSVLLIGGTFGNVMTLVVMRGLRDGEACSSMAVYFSTLAVSDQLFLLSGLINYWTKFMFDVRLRDLNEGLCKFLIFLTQWSAMTSAWILVAMTTHRMAAVVKPHLSNTVFNRKASWIAIVCIAVLTAALNSYSLVAYSVRTEGDSFSNMTVTTCDSSNHSSAILRNFQNGILVWLDLSLCSIVPFGILLVSNALLLSKIFQSVRFAKKMTSAGPGNQVLSRRKRASSVTCMVTLTSLVFLVLTLPVFPISYVYGRLPAKGDIKDSAEWRWGLFLATILYCCNSSINFYLYCLSGTKFRKQVKKYLCRS